MKTITLSVVAIVVLMIGGQSAYAETAYQSGYRHGVIDANHKDPECNCPSTDYIHQPGKGFAFHTTAFVDGYIKGYCSITGSGSGIDVNDNEDPPTVVSFDCDEGLISAYPYASDWCLIMDSQKFPVCH
jgi:hypothetical protein